MILCFVVTFVSVLDIYNFFFQPYMPRIAEDIFDIFDKLSTASLAILAIWLSVLQLKKISDEKPKLIIKNFRAFFPLIKLPLSLIYLRSSHSIFDRNIRNNVDYLFLNYVVNNVSEKPNSIIKIKYRINGNYVKRATSYSLASLQKVHGIEKYVFKDDWVNKSKFTVETDELPKPNLFLESGQSLVISDVITTTNFNLKAHKLYIEIEDAFNESHLSSQVLDKNKQPQYFSYLME
jgi:hypothetical protein